MRCKVIGNILPERTGFGWPQEGRVYEGRGLSPCMRNDARYFVRIVYENKKDKST